MSAPDVPEQLPCPEGEEEHMAEVIPHHPFRFPGIDPHQTRVVSCDEHGRHKVDVRVDTEANRIVPARGEN